MRDSVVIDLFPKDHGEQPVLIATSDSKQCLLSHPARVQVGLSVHTQIMEVAQPWSPNQTSTAMRACVSVSTYVHSILP